MDNATRQRRIAEARRRWLKRKMAQKRSPERPNRSARSERTTEESREEMRRRARAKARARQRVAAQRSESESEGTPPKPDRAKLRAEARRRFLSNSQEQERNRGDKVDVEAPVQNVDQQKQKADRPDKVDPAQQADPTAGPEFGTVSTKTEEVDEEIEEVTASNEEEEVEKESKKEARLLHIFSFVEEREKLGLSSRESRLKEISRFEDMSKERFAGYEEAMEEFKGLVEERQAKRVRASRDENQSFRLPALGRAAQSTSDDDVVTDELAFM